MIRITTFTTGTTSIGGEFEGGKMSLILNASENLPMTGNYDFTPEEMELFREHTDEYINVMVDLMLNINTRLLKEQEE